MSADLIAVSLLGGLTSDAEEIRNLRPRVAKESELLHAEFDIPVDVVAAGDEGLEVGLGASHVSSVLDASPDVKGA